MKKLLFAFSLLFMVTGCEDTAVPPPAQTFTFSGAPYSLNVASIHITQDYDAPHTLPHVEYMADMQPADVMHKWAESRLVASGKSNTLEFDIVDASIIKRNLPKKETGLTGLFTSEQTEAYDGSLEVTLKIYDGRHALPVAEVHAAAKASMTLGEDASIEDRKALYHTITLQLLNDIQVELDHNIHQYFKNYLL